MELKPYQYLTGASILITEDCNLACTYCFEKHNKNIITKEVIEKGMEFLCNNAKLANKESYHVTLFGGEPLMQPDLIRYIFDYGIKLKEKTGIDVTYQLITNATIMSDKIYILFKEYKDKIQIDCQLSVDGIEEVQNMYRITKSGGESFKMIEKNVPIFKELFGDSVSIHGCINKSSLPYLFKNYKFFREEWNMRNIWFMPVHEENWEELDVNLYEQELRKIADYEFEIAKNEKNLSEIYVYAPLDKCLSGRTKFEKPCGAGESYCTITTSGEIYPCHHFYFNDKDKEAKIGDVWNGVDNNSRKLFLNYGASDMTCSSEKCDHYNCYRCIAVNWVSNGSIFSQVRGNYCKMSKIEQKVTKELREKLEGIKLLKNKEEVVEYDLGHSIDILAKAVKIMILKMDNIEKQQAKIIELIEK